MSLLHMSQYYIFLWLGEGADGAQVLRQKRQSAPPPKKLIKQSGTKTLPPVGVTDLAYICVIKC